MEAGTKVALGMSGGVDSAVSAALLLQADCQVLGVTCRFRDSEASDKAQADAAAVCELLEIPHLVYDSTTQFERCVVGPFVDSYKQGTTPSPCVSCNATCKTPALLEAGFSHGCNRIATGHYARIARLTQNNRFVVKRALDASKDQSYMLSLLTQNQLAQLILPLGAMTKVETRIIASDLGIHVAEKAESQDNCFIEGDYRDFLKERGVCGEPGNIVNCQGEILGTHDGLLNYTVGQRKGIGIAAVEPYYVIEKRSATNELVIGFSEETQVSSVYVSSFNAQAFEKLEQPLDAMVKLRYRSRPVSCVASPVADGRVHIELRSPQPTTAPGQYAVLYEGDTMLGGGVIGEVCQA